MKNIHVIDGETQIVIDDFVSICTNLYGKKDKVNLLSFNGVLRDLYYRNISFFRLQDQKYELTQIMRSLNDANLTDSEKITSLIVLVSLIDIYSRYSFKIDMLYTNETWGILDKIKLLVNRFNIENKVHEVNDINLINILSPACFACVMMDENMFQNVDVEKVISLLRDKGEIIIIGHYAIDNINLPDDTVEINVYLIDREWYILRIKPKNYGIYLKEINDKKIIATKIIKSTYEIMEYIESISKNISILEDEILFDCIIRKVNDVANIMNGKNGLFNNQNLKFEFLEVEDSLLDVKFQKELYGNDMEYFLKKLNENCRVIKLSIEKGIYEI